MPCRSRTCPRSRLAAAAVAALGAACAGDGTGLDESGRPIGEDPPPALVPELGSIQAHVFDTHCTACHAGGGAPLGLRLEPGVSYGMLVDVPSAQQPQTRRVQPFAPDDSYLVHKLEGTAATGDRMPLDAPPLDSQTLAVIRQWIAEGAAPAAQPGSVDAGAAVAGTAGGVRSTSGLVALGPGWPLPQAELPEAPASLVVLASGELDATRVHDGTVRLLSLDRHDAATLEPAAVPGVVVTPLAGTPGRILVQVPKASWVPGRYELRMAGAGLADRAGNPVDGNGDGAAGGDFRLRFSWGEHP